MYQWFYPSPIGTLSAQSDGQALTSLAFSAFPAQEPAPVSLSIFRQTELWLNAYFSGSLLPTPPPLSIQGSHFQQAVLSEALNIPYGETITYGTLSKSLQAKGISSSSQAVGGALRQNPILLLIPCHRVLGKGGHLTGYAGGLDRKRFLLDWESSHAAP